MAEEEYDFTGLIEETCGYFEDRKSHEEFYRIPASEDEASALVGESENAVFECFDFLLAEGFRRSGGYVYRATCPDCKKCVPIRIRVVDFKFNKNQRHLLKKNSDIVMTISKEKSELVSEEKIELMRLYDKRHNPKNEMSYERSRDVLLDLNGFYDFDYNEADSPIYSGVMNMDYRLNGKLVGVGVIDVGNVSLSSNYFYYDTSDEIMKRSIGTFTILKEIEYCMENGIPLYYLGYYLSECKSMMYKGRFLPHELLIDGEWTEQNEQNFDV